MDEREELARAISLARLVVERAEGNPVHPLVLLLLARPLKKRGKRVGAHPLATTSAPSGAIV